MSAGKFAKVVEVGTAKHSNNVGKTIQYGTAGFRTKSDILDHVMYRMGVLAVLRSKVKKATIGLMITASHNPECDNGVKLVDPAGEMLEQSWEALATKIANAEDSKLAEELEAVVKSQGIDLAAPASVFVGRDTRKSSGPLAQAALDGIEAAGGISKDFGEVSTPQLHYVVVCENTKGAYGEPTVPGYYQKLTKAFKKIRGESASNGSYVPDLLYDGANGIGARNMIEFAKHLGTSLPVKVINDGTSGELNSGCGADFVKVQQSSPAGFESTAGARCVSVDGDADRVIYFFNDGQGTFRLMDGDRIATLVAGYIKELVTGSQLDLNLGLVQTAYANGSSTDYITNTLNVPVACVPTGVKHLHHRALEFDIGVYFEANGHGTVVFSQKAEKEIAAKAEQGNDSADKLRNLIDLINQTVGDAISDMLLVETVLHARGWSISNWFTAYSDLPNRQMKVRVADRNAITTTDAERKCVTPKGLQDAIDKIVKGFKNGRSFVRPSGTEDVVRVYSEADTQANADELAYQVGLKVHSMAQGVGEPTPKPS